MTFTTPDTASEPYWADAPPVTVSTRSTISVGIRLRSTVTGTPSLLAGDDGTMRLPFTNTSVRCPPRERRSAVARAGLPVLVAFAPGLRVGLKAGLRFSPDMTVVAARRLITQEIGRASYRHRMVKDVEDMGVCVSL